MVALGYALSSEEHPPDRIVRFAGEAEQHGFSFVLVSDHYHPWTDRQGQSGFVWGMLGAIAQSTSTLQVGTGVTCPIIRIHPVIIAQAAATAQILFDGRFFLGVGSGENLNEHVTGTPWPTTPVRHEMLEEAIGVLRAMWRGTDVSRRGRYFTVEEARVYSMSASPIPLYVAAMGARAAKLAGSAGDGLIGLAPERELLQTFEDAGGAGKPTIGQLTVCWAESVEAAEATVREWWPNIGLGGRLASELRTPADIEAAATPAVASALSQVVTGPDAAKYLEMIRKMTDAGYSHVYLHQVGPRQDEFMRFCERELMPALGAGQADLAGARVRSSGAEAAS